MNNLIHKQHPAIAIACLATLEDPGEAAFTLESSGREEILVVRRNDEILVYLNSCPHTGEPLDWVPGRFRSFDREHIQCATHDALFQIQDGICIAGPCTGDALQQLEAVVEDGEILVYLDYLPASLLT